MNIGLDIFDHNVAPISLLFSHRFGEIDFWWVWREKCLVLPFSSLIFTFNQTYFFLFIFSPLFFFPSSFHPELIKLLGSVSLKGWKSRKIENEKMIEMWKDERNLVFSYICLDGRMKKLRDENLFVWLRRKIRIKIRFCTNLPLW